MAQGRHRARFPWQVVLLVRPVPLRFIQEDLDRPQTPARRAWGVWNLFPPVAPRRSWERDVQWRALAALRGETPRRRRKATEDAAAAVHSMRSGVSTCPAACANGECFAIGEARPTAVPPGLQIFFIGHDHLARHEIVTNAYAQLSAVTAWFPASKERTKHEQDPKAVRAAFTKATMQHGSAWRWAASRSNSLLRRRPADACRGIIVAAPATGGRAGSSLRQASGLQDTSQPASRLWR